MIYMPDQDHTICDDGDCIEVHHFHARTERPCIEVQLCLFNPKPVVDIYVDQYDPPVGHEVYLRDEAQ